MTPKALVEHLEVVVGIEGPPVRLRAAIETVLTKHFAILAIQAAERAEQIEEKIAKMIAERAAACERAGTSPVLVLLGSNSDSVAGFCHVLAGDTAPVVTLKQQRIHANAILMAMRSLSFSEFELFGARVLTKIGAKNAHITPHSGDQGIDFFGDLSLGQLHAVPAPFLRLARDIVVLFVGQAKHYPNGSLGPDVVRELIGAVSLVRTKTFSQSDVDMFRNLGLKPFSPLVTLLFTTGKITSGAAELARSAGITACSAEQLAVFLADSGVGIIQSPGGPCFDGAAFTSWLNAG